MIIVINAQGKVVAQQFEDLFQGSVNANVIDLVAPFATNITMYASFELPDGTLYAEKEMKQSIKVIDGLNVWRLPLNFPITKNYGSATVQFRAEVGNQTICSGSAKIPIQKGVPYQEKDDLEQTQYEELRAMISDIKALLGNKVEIVAGNYQVAKVNEDTVGIYYIYKEETDTYLPVSLPEEYNSYAQYYTLSNIGRVINDPRGVFIEYEQDGQKTTLKLTQTGATINDSNVITEDNLFAEKVKYNDKETKLGVDDVQEAIEKLKYDLGDIQNSQVIDIGNHTINSNGWVADGDVYTYRFKNELFTDALVQGLIVTPDKEAIDNLNENDILLYPEIDIEQESEGVAVAVLKADKKPQFDMVVNVKIQGTTIDVKAEGIKAGQIVFLSTDKITGKTVQKAIENVQSNLENFEAQYISDKAGFVKLDGNGKVPASQLPSFVDDVIECYLHNAAMYLTRTGSGTDDNPYVYTDILPAVSGKIYVDLQTNKQYRWGGTQYVIISESLALGETADSAYSGEKGKTNAENIQQNAKDINHIETEINNIKYGTTEVYQSLYTKHLIASYSRFGNFTSADISETGTYIANVEILNEGVYTLVIDIVNLNNDVKSLGLYYNGNYNNGIYYSASDQKLHTTNEQVLYFKSITGLQSIPNVEA